MGLSKTILLNTLTARSVLMYYWETPDYLLEPPYDECDECKNCLHHEQSKDDCKDYLKGVIEQIYSDKPLDLAKLEFCLDNLCFHLEVKKNLSEPKVVRKNVSVFENSVNHWKQQIKQKFITHLS